MIKLFSINDRVFLKNIQNSEAQLNRFLSENWEYFFPQYTFIKSEFPLDGIVRTSGSGGRIDILAFNPSSNKFVVFELKRDSSKNIKSQAADYNYAILRDFHKIHNSCTDDWDAKLPRPKAMVQDSIETVLIANTFSSTDIEMVNKFKSDEITLIKYFWFESNILLIEYLNNTPSEQSQKTFNEEQAHTKPFQSIAKSQQEINSSRIDTLNHVSKKGPQTKLEVSINGQIFDDSEAINTLIKVIKMLGPERVKDNVNIGGSYPLVIRKNDLSHFKPGKYKSIDNQFYVYSNNNTINKKRFLDIIATRLKEKIKVDIIPK
jgi:hypothetical protein